MEYSNELFHLTLKQRTAHELNPEKPRASLRKGIAYDCIMYALCMLATCLLCHYSVSVLSCADLHPGPLLYLAFGK